MTLTKQRSSRKLCTLARMRRNFWLLLMGSLLVSLSWRPRSSTDEALKLLEDMLEETGRLQTLRYEFKKYERIRGKLMLEHMTFKLRRNPFAVYGYQHSPRKGVEVLYPAETGSQKLLVKPNTFPYLPLTLDPYGNLVLEGQHQTILATGYDQLRSLLLAAKKRYANQVEKLVRSGGRLTWDGVPCQKIILEPPQYEIQTYTVQQGDNLFRIAEKRHVGWYKIMELNGFSSPNVSLSPGTVLKVPSDYGKVIRLTIDEKRKIPLVVEVEDELGLYERYEYYKLEVNPPLTDLDFSRKNPAYNF
jgi:LysM repeat protein